MARWKPTRRDIWKAWRAISLRARRDLFRRHGRHFRLALHAPMITSRYAENEIIDHTAVCHDVTFSIAECSMGPLKYYAVIGTCDNHAVVVDEDWQWV